MYISTDSSSSDNLALLDVSNDNYQYSDANESKMVRYLDKKEELVKDDYKILEYLNAERSISE